IARDRAVEVLLRSVIASPMVKYRGPFVLEMPADAWFDVGMMQKDLRLALGLGRSVGAVLPSTALAHELLTGARGLGLADLDFAVVFDVLASMRGRSPSAKAARVPAGPWAECPEPAQEAPDGTADLRHDGCGLGGAGQLRPAPA